MQLGFEDNSLRTLCNSEKRLRQTFGNKLAICVQRLLWVLDAAPTLADISSSPPISRRFISDGDPPIYAVGPQGPGQILLAPMEPYEAEDRIDRVTIYDIEGRK